jgi:hypothetical protein
MLAQADWPEFWAKASGQLRALGLQTGTLRVYRHVLRSFRGFLTARGAGARPACATPALAREFLYRLAYSRYLLPRAVDWLGAGALSFRPSPVAVTPPLAPDVSAIQCSAP